ncbi:MAG: N-acetylmuramoyl-L-alanine amidase [Oscillospiraceae bacterium]|nr:N-acetylmuramoyl-L-alanine amidase [Oscillospiraceae bacterium]
MRINRRIKTINKILAKIKNHRRTFIVTAVLGIGGLCIAYGFSRVEKSVMTFVPVIEQEKPIIVIDAGHGGIDGGCSAADGTPEKGINLNILLTLRDMFEASGFETDVTRDTDRSIHDDGIEGIANQKSSDMDNRLAKFNEHKNAICISIHQNQYTDPKYSGAQMFYSTKGSSKSRDIAQNIQNKFVEYLQPENKREIKECGKELFLCYFSENPTVMVECGFLSNPEEAARLEDPEYQKMVAFTVYSGIIESLK